MARNQSSSSPTELAESCPIRPVGRGATRPGVSASAYHPLSGEATETAPGRDIPLDFSIRIDTTGRYERLFGVFCAAPVALEPLRAELQETGRITAPAGCRVDTLGLKKRGDPK